LVIIGLGSNQGQSSQVVSASMRALQEFAQAATFRCSSLWRTTPVDCPPGSSDFINAAVGFEARPGLTPEALLEALKAIEVTFGRGKTVIRNAPRELDLDLLVFDEERRDTDTFTLPHPRAIDRLFVLAPVAEIAPELRWPGNGMTVAELLDVLETDEQVLPLAHAPQLPDSAGRN
jgi:2-amino-4-hydroxy-6-hydroxymethyldihydropteridine diphosphokinase